MDLVNYYKKLIEFLSLLLGIENKSNLVFAKDKRIIYNEKNIEIDYIDVSAKFFTENETIYINLDKHNLQVHDEIFSVIHEYRHYYQLNQILHINSLLEDEDIIKVWKENFDNYINFGDDGFYKQDVEIDANAFTIFIIQKLFQKGCYINPKFDRNMINKYFDLYEKKYTDNKIQSKLKETKVNVLHLFEIRC